MELLNLPEDVMAIIITRFLDIQSIATLYNTGNTNLRELIVRHIRKCQLSRSNVATVRFFQTRFYQDISGHIQELDMAMIPNIQLADFHAAITNLRKVKFLNVSFTNIILYDVVVTINPSTNWPELKNIHVNLGHLYTTRYMNYIDIELLRKAQNFVQQLENIHLVITLSDLLWPKLLFNTLETANLNCLNLTVLNVKKTCTMKYRFSSRVPVFKQLYIRILDWYNTKKCFPSLIEFPILTKLDLKKYEFIIIFCPSLTSHTVFVSSLFENFFSEHFNLDATCISELNDVSNEDTAIPGNVAVMLWKKDAFNFDDKFFKNLIREITQYFPYSPRSDEISVPNRYDWFVLTPMIAENKDTFENNSEGTLVLDYDTLFANKQKIQISLDLSHIVGIPITLNSNSSYLSKITYLSLCGLSNSNKNSGPCLTRYAPDFFDTLFRYCTTLDTLNFEATKEAPCWLYLCNTLKLSSTLKNFRLMDSKIDMNYLFSALMDCRSLENVFIILVSTPHTEGLHTYKVPNTLFQSCPNLYNLFIRAGTHRGNCTTYNPEFTLCKSFANVERLPNLCANNSGISYPYDSFIDVFKLNPIRDTVYFGAKSH